MADSKLTDLSAASALAGTEVTYGVQSAADVKITAAQIKTFTSASPVLVTPNLGTPSAGVLTSCTSLPSASINTGNLSIGTSGVLTAGTIELGAASDTTISRTGAGAIAVEGVGVALNSTSLAHTASTIELGAASDTTIARVGAGVISVEGSTVAMLGTASQTLAGGANVTALTQAAGNLTFNPGLRPLQFQTNSGAFTLTAPAADGSGILLSTNDGSAGTITFSGFSVGSSTGDALTTTNTHKFSIHIWRINGVSGYRIAAHQ